MRVALCISGQPRTWKKSYPTWVEHLLPGVQKDIFFHMWDYNTLPGIVLQSGVSKLEDVPISDEEKQEILDTYSPKKYKFDSRNINPLNGDKDPSILSEYVNHPLGWWCRSQYHSLYYAANLKRQYEIENNFEYDVVFRMRTDLYFMENLNMPSNIRPNELYSKSNGYMDSVEAFMIGDTFYFADSFTYDQVSEFVQGLTFIDSRHVAPAHIACPPPEVGLYPFLCASGIKNVSCPQDIKILRNQEYLDIRGGLAQYEVV